MNNPLFRDPQSRPGNTVERLNPTTLRVTRVSPATGRTNVLDLPITEDQWRRYQGGEYAQRALGHLDDTQREFIMSGYFGTEFEDTFREEDDF